MACDQPGGATRISSTSRNSANFAPPTAARAQQSCRLRKKEKEKRRRIREFERKWVNLIYYQGRNSQSERSRFGSGTNIQIICPPLDLSPTFMVNIWWWYHPGNSRMPEISTTVTPPLLATECNDEKDEDEEGDDGFSRAAARLSSERLSRQSSE